MSRFDRCAVVLVRLVVVAAILAPLGGLKW